MIPYIQLATMHNYTLNATLYELMINIEHEQPEVKTTCCTITHGNSVLEYGRETKILSLIVKVCSTFMLSVFDLPTVYQESLVVAITQTQKLSSSTLQHFNSCMQLQPFYRVDTTEGIDSLSRVAKPQRKITRWLERPNLQMRGSYTRGVYASITKRSAHATIEQIP